MIDIDFLVGLRTLTVVVLGIVLVVFTTRYLRAYREISTSQRLYIGAMLLFTLTLGWDTLIFLAEDTSFSWRLLPLLAGLSLCVAYLVEPYQAARRRFGKEIYDPMGASEEERAMATEIAELKDQLYQALRRENKAELRALDLETYIENQRRHEADRNCEAEGQ